MSTGTLHQDFRPLCVHDGRDLQPLVCKLNAREILFRHHSSKADIPVPWLQFIGAAAATAGQAPLEFLQDLIKKLEADEARGLGAPTTEKTDGGDSPGSH